MLSMCTFRIGIYACQAGGTSRFEAREFTLGGTFSRNFLQKVATATLSFLSF